VLFELEQRGRNISTILAPGARLRPDEQGQDPAVILKTTWWPTRPQHIETKAGEIIDWLVDSDLRQWQAVNEHLAERRRQHADRIVGDTAGSLSTTIASA